MTEVGSVSPSYGTPWRRLAFVSRLGFEAAPSQMLLALGIAAFGAVSSLVYPLAFRTLINGVLERHVGTVTIGAAVVGVFYAIMWAAGILLAVEGVSLVDRVSFHLSCRIAELAYGVRGIEHFERQDYLRELELLDQNRRVLASGPRQALLLLQVALRSVGIMVVLAAIDVRLVALAAFAIPAALATRASVARLQRAEEETIDVARLTNDLFALNVTAGPAKELRTALLSEELRQRHTAGAELITSTFRKAAIRSAAYAAAGWAVYGFGFGGVLALLIHLVEIGHASVGDVLLTVTLIRLVQLQVARVSDILGQLLVTARLASRFLWLEDYATEQRTIVRQLRAPSRLAKGVKLEHVTFSYPGTDRRVLDDVSMFLPAGSTIALVGENGAGKTTIVKLLTGMYEPTGGRILLDDVDLSQVDSSELRTKFAAVFQDFLQLELSAREAVGTGDLVRIDDDVAVLTAIDRAGASDMVGALPMGLDTRLGRTFRDGVELSGGQWQKLALSRGMMRDRPLILVLDEPTANLDAATEYELFKRYAEQSRRARNASGAITLLVSHRFSTVRMADLIVVLDDGRIRELGSHATLLAQGGLYAELYSLQAVAFA